VPNGIAITILVRSTIPGSPWQLRNEWTCSGSLSLTLSWHQKKEKNSNLDVTVPSPLLNTHSQPLSEQFQSCCQYLHQLSSDQFSGPTDGEIVAPTVGCLSKNEGRMNPKVVQQHALARQVWGTIPDGRELHQNYPNATFGPVISRNMNYEWTSQGSREAM